MFMNTFIAISIIFLCAVVLGALYIVHRRLTTLVASLRSDQSLVLLQQQMNEISRTVDAKLGESTQFMQKQHSESLRVISDITQKLTQLDETNKQVIGFSQQLQNLEKVLTNQKQRGNLGEQALRLVMENVLPPTAYAFQYKIDEGAVVDAVIFFKDGLIPVDAKFSLDNYRRIIDESNPERKAELETEFKRDLMKRIDETSKYIKPGKGTLDFAFMFIPTEAIYYDLLVNEVGAVKVNTRSLIDYAFKDKHVIIVSPTTFAAYLQTVLFGLQALKIEKSAQEIRKQVSDLTRHLNSYDAFMTKVGNHLGTTVNAFNDAYKEMKKIDKDMIKISGESAGIEPMQLDRPRIEQ